MDRQADAVGIVLNRNEIWLLLNALAATTPPALQWDGNPLEPWQLGDLRAKLRAALQPHPLKDVDRRPVISLDSEMGKDLAAAGIQPLVSPDGYDIGSLLAACAERGWGAELTIPRGATPADPANAVVRVRRDREGLPPEEATYVGLERPVVALARAMIGALVEAPSREAIVERQAIAAAASAKPATDRFEQHVIRGVSISRGQKHRVIKDMANQGWELVLDDIGGPEDHLVFRRPAAKAGLDGKG